MAPFLLTEKKSLTWIKSLHHSFLLYPQSSKNFILIEFDSHSKDFYFKMRSLLWQKRITHCFLSNKLNPSAFFFDMDATIIQQETIDVLSEKAGVAREVKKITELAMRGEINFRTALEKRLSLIGSRLNLNNLNQIQKKLKPNRGIKELLKYINSQKHYSAIVSGGFSLYADHFKKQLKFSEAFSHSLEIKDDHMTGKILGKVIDGKMKKTWVQKKMREKKLKAQQVCIVGDGANDRFMMGLAGLSIGHSPKPILESYCQGANFSGDHRFICLILKTIELINHKNNF